MSAKFFTFFPQFCSEPINDIAWGKGFTDWELIKSLPPNIAREFTPQSGFYNPADREYINQLGSAVRTLGGNDAGLMLYHYFFDGIHALASFEQKLLELDPGIPFFLCWANESWTKRWRGKPNEFIARQLHKLDTETTQSHASYLAALFDLPSYLKINGRPVFIIYEPHAVKHMATVIENYRRNFECLGYNPFIGACISYPQSTPFKEIGFDFVQEFQPRYFFNQQRGSIVSKVGAKVKASAPATFDYMASVLERLKSAKNQSREYRYREYLCSINEGRLESSLRVTSDGLPIGRSTFLTWNNLPRYGSFSVRVDHQGVAPNDLKCLSQINSDLQLPVIVNSWNE